ncbi:mannose-6-phosphate isomerase class I [Ruminococcus sp. CAG:353]|nr:class I mannose-6-phosphate isomerase [Ruminococcus sp.]CDE81126.1 mannose-6-phosphate isomerase class I [Ruminococcus sp. CAG:353]
MYPIKLKPAFKDYLWGGTRLRDDFGKDCDFDKIAESWELSCHKDGNSVVADGEFAGLTLAQYIEKEGKSVLGTNCEKFENFPILIKLIDAKDNLSVQVHPNNEYAQRVEGEYGKTEMWYVVDCDEGASLLYGFKHNITKEEFRERIENNTLLEVTNSVPVKKGDVFFIEAGTLHAIGKGILIAEIQQNSNTTYRIYDYGRVGADGKPRQLHIDKAVDVTNLCPAKPYPQSEPVDMDGWTKKRLAKCEYFTVDVINVDTSAALEADKSSFVNILVLDGGCVLSSEGNDAVELKKGDSVFIPAGLGKFELTGKCSAVMTHID